MERVLRRLAIASLACFAYGTFVEPYDFQVRRVRLKVLPAGAQPIRVLHLSDFHLVTGQRRKREFIQALSGLEPDLVISTGDNLASPDALAPLIDDLGRLLDAPGAFVFGSNDYTAPRPRNPLGYLAGDTSREGVHADRQQLPTEELRTAFTSHGWLDLNRRRGELEVRGLRIEFRGTDDAHLNLDDYRLVAGPPARAVDLAVGVTHAPYARVLDAMTADGLQLMLAGHTHGGQVCVPGVGALTTNCDLAPRRAKGASRHHASGKRSWLHVSAGLGANPYTPFRFACPPEVSVLTLVPGSNG